MLESQGFSYSMLDRYQEALADCDQAVRLDPEYAHAYSLRGYVRAAIGDQKGELTDLTRYVQMRPNDGDALLRRGQLLLKMGDSVQGCRDLHRAIDLFTQGGDQNGARLAREALSSQSAHKNLKLGASEETLDQPWFSPDSFPRRTSILSQMLNIKEAGVAQRSPFSMLPDAFGKMLLRDIRPQTNLVDWMQPPAAEEPRDGIGGSGEW